MSGIEDSSVAAAAGILVAIDGLKERLSESQLLGRLLNDPRGKRALPAVVLRGDQRKQIVLPRPE